MLPIACLTQTCFSMMLGVGYIMTQTPDALLYRSMSEDAYFYCQGSSGYYQCQRLDPEAAKRLERRQRNLNYGRYQ